MYYKTKYGKSYDAKLYKCILKWGELTKGNTITISDCKDVFDYLLIDFPESELKNKSDVYYRRYLVILKKIYGIKFLLTQTKKNVST